MRYPSENTILGLFFIIMLCILATSTALNNPPVIIIPQAQNYFTNICSTPSGIFDKCLFGDHQQDI